MTYSFLKLDVDGAVATVTLNRPDRRNAFDDRLIDELAQAFRAVDAEDRVRAVVLCGEGKSFCAGADLEWMGRMAGYSREENLDDAGRAQAMFDSLDRCSKVTIAAIHGAAVGGGAGLAACCDIAIAAQGTVFAFSEVRLGIAPSIIAPYVLRKIGMGHARALFVTGRRFDAAEASRIGLVQQVVEAEHLDAVVASVVGEVLQSGPSAIAAIKSLLRDLPAESDPDVVRAVTVDLIARLRVSDEGQKGLKAFLEKRKPNFAE